MAHEVLSSVISGASGLVQAGINWLNNKQQLKNQQKINEQNHQYALEQNKWNEDMWEKNNEYNSPAHQRELLLEGGYNPALFSPEGMAATAPQSANLATSDMISNDPAAMQGFNQGLSQFANAGLNYLNAKKIQAETNKITSEIPQILEMTKQIQATTHMTEEQAKIYAVQIDEANQRIRQSQEQINLMRQQGKKIDYDIRYNNQQMRLLIKTTEANINKTLSDISINEANKKKIAQEIFNMSKVAALTGKQIEAADLNNIYQRIVNEYADESQRGNIEKMSADIYRSLTGEVQRNINGIVQDLMTNLRNGLGINRFYKGANSADMAGTLYDRINRKGGFLNQE